MTDRPDTIEQQLIEQQRQYTFLENVCEKLTETVGIKDREIERQDRLIHALRETIKELDHKLTAAICQPEHVCACKGNKDVFRGC